MVEDGCSIELEWEGYKKNEPRCYAAGFEKIPAITYSRAESTTIGPECLTAVFGMGTGVAIQVLSPEYG